MSKRNFHKRTVENEVKQKIKQGSSRHEILEDLCAIYNNPNAIAKIVATAFKKKTKVKVIKVKVK